MEYLYKNLEIISNEKLTCDGLIEKDASADIISNGVKTVIYLFRAPIGSTKLVGYMSKKMALKGEIESLKMLYDQESLQSESVVAVNLNYFEHRFSCSDDWIEDVINYLEAIKIQKKQKKKVTLLGLGDVGSMLSIGLKLLGNEVIESIGIFDISDAQKSRWEMELGQIAVNPSIRIHAISQEELFLSDVFIFCASKGIPKVGDDVKDVRMIQFEENAKLISHYALLARDSNFEGLFAVVSDPVDLLCKQVFTASNYDGASKTMDFHGLLPEQVIGFGLGVMDGRAQYYSALLGMNYAQTGRVFGPHGKDLIVSEDILNEDQTQALKLTKRVVEANLEMRALGFKPFVAPAISSGASSIVLLLAGKPHYSAVFLHGVYWGNKNTLSDYGVDLERLKISNSLMKRLESTYNTLEDTWGKLNS